MVMDFFSELIKEILNENESHRRFLTNALNFLTDDEKRSLASYIAFLSQEGKSITYIADCYNSLVNDVVKEQLYFLKHKKYRFSKYTEVEAQIYLNDEYMEKYMIGLGISTFLWPQHLKIYRFFINSLPRDDTGNYLEIGPGHGFYFMDAMKNTAYTSFDGIDISPKSIFLTNRIIKSNFFGKFDNYRIFQSDFTKFKSEKKYDAIIAGEVLEHVERPDLLLRKIHSIANKESFIFLTTVINAPAVDHIFLFDSIESIEKLVSETGFTIKKIFFSPAYNKFSIDENLKKKLPIDVALILSVT
jgi:2-polyprenyl-3-methyl-5-hydroxy-6-metoxy-1,4-benzoquinol methylase